MGEGDPCRTVGPEVKEAGRRGCQLRDPGGQALLVHDLAVLRVWRVDLGPSQEPDTNEQSQPGVSEETEEKGRFRTGSFSCHFL